MILEVSNVSFKYPMAGKNALKGISFTLEKGDCCAIIGQNNSGKSTLCCTLNGIIPHFFKGDYSGDVVLNGVNTRDAALKDLVAKVGLVFQNPFTQLTGTTDSVFEELAVGLENYGVDRHSMIRRINAVLKELHIEELKDRLPFSLSGGQQQKVALASIVIMNPEILILDEPTSQLDPGASEEIFQLIATLRDHGTTIIFVEHKIEEVARYANKVLVLSDGEIKQFGAPKNLLSSRELQKFDIRPTKYTELGYKLSDEGLWSKTIPVTFEEAKQMVGEILYDGRH
jgi:energy-coupling factor transporter ATP-binding protein EcfA2